MFSCGLLPVVLTAILPGKTLQWRHNGCDSASNHQPHDCLLKLLFSRRSKKTSKFLTWWRHQMESFVPLLALCEGNSPVTGEFPSQRASNGTNDSIWWRHHVRKNILEYVCLFRCLNAKFTDPSRQGYRVSGDAPCLLCKRRSSCNLQALAAFQYYYVTSYVRMKMSGMSHIWQVVSLVGIVYKLPLTSALTGSLFNPIGRLNNLWPEPNHTD